MNRYFHICTIYMNMYTADIFHVCTWWYTHAPTLSLGCIPKSTWVAGPVAGPRYFDFDDLDDQEAQLDIQTRQRRFFNRALTSSDTNKFGCSDFDW